jgi:hypothetical protein
MTHRWVLLLALAACVAASLWPRDLAAQAQNEGDGVRVGDRWIFEEKDEITGEPKGTYSAIVTEVSEKEIVTNVNVRGRNGSRMIVFDHDWNRVDDSIWKYKPNEGGGIRLPLEVGKQWRSEYDAVNMQTGAILRTTALSKVVAQEAVTTPAGTFDTFKIERHLRQVNTVDRSKGSETDIVMWYAPRINHWVKRTFLTKVEHRTRSNNSEELTDFSRKM